MAVSRGRDLRNLYLQLSHGLDGDASLVSAFLRRVRIPLGT